MLNFISNYEDKKKVRQRAFPLSKNVLFLPSINTWTGVFLKGNSILTVVLEPDSLRIISTTKSELCTGCKSGKNESAGNESSVFFKSSFPTESSAS